MAGTKPGDSGHAIIDEVRQRGAIDADGADGASVALSRLRRNALSSEASSTNSPRSRSATTRPCRSWNPIFAVAAC